MNLGLSLLDELEFARAPMLGRSSQQTSLAPSLVRSMPVSGSQRAIQLRSPYFIRGLGAAEFGAAWAPLCGALRRHDIPIFSTVKNLAGIPAADAPARWSGRPFDEPFQSMELTTAGLFEVSCISRDQRHLKWPGEICPELIDSLLRSVRAAAGGDTPVGFNVALGCHPSDLKQCLAADIDFISLSCTHAMAATGSQLSHQATSGVAASEVQPHTFLAGDLHSIVLCRQMLQQLNRPQLPLLVTAPVIDFEQAHKLLALGASAVSLDQIGRQSIALEKRPSKEEEPVPDLPFRLPALPQSAAPAAKRPELPQLENLLKQARQTLCERLLSVGADNLADFNQQCLVSISQRAQRVTGVRRLEL